MAPQTLATRARERCAQHHGTDYCSRCIREELDQVLLEENPELCRDDATNIVSEWFLRDAGGGAESLMEPQRAG